MESQFYINLIFLTDLIYCNWAFLNRDLKYIHYSVN